MKKFISLFSAVLIFTLVACVFSVVPVSGAETKVDYTLHTKGNMLLNAQGEAIRLIGLNVPYMSWSENCRKEVLEALDIGFTDWDSNAVRLAVTPKSWFGANRESYRALTDEVIEITSAAGKYVILDNHSFYLPDDDDIAFWADAAARYKDHPNVVFEVFNEPAIATWQQYYEGGTLSYKGVNDWGEEDDITINSCGMPKLLSTIRDTDAKNVCILPGINWSFDLSYCTEKNFKELAKSIGEAERPNDVDGFVKEYTEKYFMKETTGNGIMYSTHPYPSKPSDWDTYLKDTALEYPILVGECGPTEKESGFIRALTDNDKSYLDTLTDYVDKYEMHITPWAWGAWPFLNQEPTAKLSAFGSYMFKYFERSNETKAVTFYDKTDYTGEKFTLEVGKYDGARIKELGFDITKLASVSAKVDYYQYTITLYEKSGFSGKSHTFVPNTSDVSKSVIGFTVNSVKIERSVPVNILPGRAKITATGSLDNQVAENIIDGKTKTFWKNKDENKNEIVISLDKLYAINGITLAHASEASMMSVYNASDYTVSVSIDGKNFTRIIDVTDNSLGLCKYRFEQVLASYIKVTITKGSIRNKKEYYLAEVMAYGTEYTGSTENMSVTINRYGNQDKTDKSDSNTVEIVLIGVFSAVILASGTLMVLFAKRSKKRT